MKNEQDRISFQALARACADGRSVSQASPAVEDWCAVSGVCGFGGLAAVKAGQQSW